jgi:hypothetical protein
MPLRRGGKPGRLEDEHNVPAALVTLMARQYQARRIIKEQIFCVAMLPEPVPILRQPRRLCRISDRNERFNIAAAAPPAYPGRICW